MKRTCLILTLLSGFAAAAAEPDVQSINVRGLQIGGTTSITIDGDRLGPNPRLLLPFNVKTTLKSGATDKKVVFDVYVDDSATPGYHHLRVITDGGASLPILIGVDKLPQAPLSPSIAQIPAAITGAVSGSTIAETMFTGKAGQKVMIEVESQRLGGKLRPIVHLYGPKRLQVAWSWPMQTLLGDTRLEATLPVDGSYAIAIHDAEYATPSPGYFRLKIGQWSYADQVFPPVAGKDTRSVDLIGSTIPLRVDVPASSPYAILPWPKDGTWSGPRPTIEVSSRTELLEHATNGKPQELPAGAVGVSGRLSTPYEENLYRVPVTPNSRVRLEVFADRLRSPIDVAIAVRNETGGDLARGADIAGTLDTVLDYAVPDKVSSVLVAVVDAQGRGGPRGIYHLVVEPAQSNPRADVRLYTPTQRMALPTGGRYVVPIFADRRRYAGRIDLSAEGLPGGMKLDNAAILPGNDGTLVTLTQTAAGTAAISNWRGRGDNGIDRPVVLRGHPLEKLQPWLANELAIASKAGKADEFSIDWRGLAADAGMVPSVKQSLPIAVKRPDPNTVVRLSLLSSQAPPMANNQPNPNAAIRIERPTELAAKTSDGEVPILLPPELPSDGYDIAVQADILTPDKRTVLATVFTPVRRMAVKIPASIKFDGTSTIAVTLDAKGPTNVDLNGTLERRDGFTGDVALAFTGLPAGVRADAVTVKTGATKFAVKLVLPPNLAVGEIKGIKLAGTFAPDAKQPNQRIKSRDVELVLNIQPGKK
jgi:hypothetical protein